MMICECNVTNVHHHVFPVLNFNFNFIHEGRFLLWIWNNDFTSAGVHVMHGPDMTKYGCGSHVWSKIFDVINYSLWARSIKH